MVVSDDSQINTLERHLASIQENIDQYISSHYQPPYVEHDLDLEEECDEDELVAFPSIGAMPGQALLTEERCFSSEEDAFPMPEHLEIDDFLRQQGKTFSQMLLRLIDERNLKDSQVYRDANIDRRHFGHPCG